MSAEERGEGMEEEKGEDSGAESNATEEEERSHSVPRDSDDEESAERFGLREVMDARKTNEGELAKLAEKERKAAEERNMKKELVKQGRPVAATIWYPGGAKVVGFQCGLRVPKGKDVISTYYMACGWHRGYFGMQVNSCLSERRILFSCWDDGTQTRRGNDVKVPEHNPVCLVKRFGGEGTGRQCIRWHDWEPESLMLFRVFAKPDQETKTTSYRGYFKQEMETDWHFMCEYISPTDGKYLAGLYSFIENFGSDRTIERECYYSHQAIQVEGSEEWHPMSSAKGSISACPEDDFYSHRSAESHFIMTIGGTAGIKGRPDYVEPKVPGRLYLQTPLTHNEDKYRRIECAAE